MIENRQHANPSANNQQSSILIMAQGCCVRHQGNGPCTFDSSGQLSLVLGAIARYPPWNNLSPLCGKEPKRPRVFIINGKARIGTEPTNLSSAEESPVSILCHLFVPPAR
jgi:hypothetical protein